MGHIYWDGDLDGQHTGLGHLCEEDHHVQTQDAEGDGH